MRLSIGVLTWLKELPFTPSAVLCRRRGDLLAFARVSLPAQWAYTLCRPIPGASGRIIGKCTLANRRGETRVFDKSRPLVSTVCYVLIADST